MKNYTLTLAALAASSCFLASTPATADTSEGKGKGVFLAALCAEEGIKRSDCAKLPNDHPLVIQAGEEHQAAVDSVSGKITCPCAPDGLEAVFGIPSNLDAMIATVAEDYSGIKWTVNNTPQNKL